MQIRQQNQSAHPVSCSAPHRHWPENAHLECYAQAHGATYEARIRQKFEPGARVCVAGRYVAGGFTEPHSKSGELGTVTQQVGARVSVALDARDYDDDVDDFTAAALDLVSRAV
jgi:hypothetical protein